MRSVFTPVPSLPPGGIRRSTEEPPLKAPSSQDKLWVPIRRTPEVIVNIDVVHAVQTHVRAPHSRTCVCTAHLHALSGCLSLRLPLDPECKEDGSAQAQGVKSGFKQPF